MEAKDNMIPFDEQKWKEGWKPVTRDGREVEEFKTTPFDLSWCGLIDGLSYGWYRDGSFFSLNTSKHDLMLLPPDDEIVVEFEEGNDGINGIAVPPGKYRLTKIG